MFDVSGNLKRQCHVRPELYGSWVLISQRYSGFYYCAVFVVVMLGFFFNKKSPKLMVLGIFWFVLIYFYSSFLLFIFVIYQVDYSSLAEDSFLMSFLTSFAVPSTVVVVRPKLPLAKPPPNGDLPA